MTDDTGHRGVAAWFDATYRSEGCAYLRPLAAYPIFVQLVGARRGDRLLDVACGPGLLLRTAHLFGAQPHGVDLSQQAVAMARAALPEAEVCIGSAEELPFPDNSFDCITCIAALERFLDREAALLEMRRVARAGARFCFMVRNARTLSWKLWRRGLRRQNLQGHQDALPLTAWRDLFRRCGFTVERVLPDQWPRQRLRWLLRGGRHHRFPAPEPIARPLLPLSWANEFVFLLS